MRLRSGDLRPNTFLNCQDPKGQIADIVLTSKKLFREFSAIFGDPIYGQGCLSHLWPVMFVQARSQTVESLRGQGWELALACIMIRIHLETGPRRVTEVNAGTREQGRELALEYMWRIHMETGPRRVAESIAGTAQIRCGRGMTPACQWETASSSQASE